VKIAPEPAALFLPRGYDADSRLLQRGRKGGGVQRESQRAGQQLKYGEVL
jgi:hypothetical protein